MRKRKRKQSHKALNSWLIQRLRRAHMAWSPKSWALAEARVGPNQYKCADCGSINTSSEVDIDHIEPVIDPLDGNMLPNGERDWHKTVTRMFVQKDGYAVLCIGCHIIKTWLERQLRDNTVPFEWEYLFQDDLELKLKIMEWKETLDGSSDS